MTELDGQQDFIARAANHRILSRREEVELAKRRDAGDESARHALVAHNVRLAISITRKYQNRGVPFEDLLQEALIGLDHASRKFDHKRGYKFSTYATWWVRKAVQRGLDRNGGLIHLPGKVAGARLKLQASMAEDPDAELESHAAKHGLTERQAQRALDAAKVVASVDAVVVDSNDFLESVPDPEAADPADLVDDSRELHAALAELPEQQRRVLELRFGVTDGDARSLTEVAVELGIPASVVRAEQRAALTALRRWYDV